MQSFRVHEQTSLKSFKPCNISFYRVKYVNVYLKAIFQLQVDLSDHPITSYTTWGAPATKTHTTVFSSAPITNGTPDLHICSL